MKVVYAPGSAKCNEWKKAAGPLNHISIAIYGYDIPAYAEKFVVAATQYPATQGRRW
jgi:hypothetical protein